MNRDDRHFPPHHSPLREDIHTLGELLGSVLREQGGDELYELTEAGSDGVKRARQRLERGNLEELRAIAQTFTAQGKAVFLATVSEPPSLLLATSPDSGVDAGQTLKTVLQATGGRGGGTARMAQGSVPDEAALAVILEKIA